jgi:hypothetical protein
MLIPIYLLFFARLTLARAVISNAEFDIRYGVPFRIRWEEAEGPVTLGVSIIRKNDVLPYATLLGTYSIQQRLGSFSFPVLTSNLVI